MTPGFFTMSLKSKKAIKLSKILYTGDPVLSRKSDIAKSFLAEKEKAALSE